jgi:hypothetical protein
MDCDFTSFRYIFWEPFEMVKVFSNFWWRMFHNIALDSDHTWGVLNLISDRPNHVSTQTCPLWKTNEMFVYGLLEVVLSHPVDADSIIEKGTAYLCMQTHTISSTVIAVILANNTSFCYINICTYIQGGSNMTGTIWTHKSVPVIFESPCTCVRSDHLQIASEWHA